MLDLAHSNTVWLHLTNIGLGVVTLICCFMIGRTLLQEFVPALKRRATTSVEPDDHSFLEPGLGLTMADGGERIEKEGRR